MSVLNNSQDIPRRRGRPPQLSRDLILEEAGRQDIRQLTVRGLAARLRVSDAAIHYHFAGRDGLLRALVERLSMGFEPPPSILPWPDWLIAFAHRLREVLARHPGAANYMVTNGPSGPRQYAVMDGALAVLEAGGFSPADAWLAYATVVNFVLRHVQVEEQPTTAESPSSPTGMREARIERLASLVEAGVVEDLDRLFAFGLEAIVRGLERA